MKIYNIRTILFSLLIAYYPILSSYGIRSGNVDFATILLLGFFVCTLPTKLYKNMFLPLIAYTVCASVISIVLIENYEVSLTLIFFRLAKITIVLFLVFVCGYWQEYYNEKFVFSYIKKMIYIATFFIVAQRVLFVLGTVLKNPFIEFAIDAAYINEYTMVAGAFFRPSAFFLEPAHFTLYAFVFLVYSLFHTHNMKDTLVVCVGILCTGSGMGVVGIGVFIASYVLIQLRQRILTATLISTSSILLYFWLVRMPFFRYVIERFTTDNTQSGGNAIQARIGVGYEMFLQTDLYRQLFGSGYGNIIQGEYFNGMTYVLNTLGIIGALIFCLTILNAIHHGSLWKKIGLLSFLGLSFLSQMFTPASLVFYFCIYGTNLKKEKDTFPKERLV
ncbi:MAG: hypothetical protein Q4A10_03860 [Aerococcaceae bacterium]|nr:hypothetical protein [Aerococcaceae bacterium]